VEKIRVLIVDDEPLERLVIRQLLRAEPDVEIIGECADGREAVVAINEREPDIVFLDVQMPLMDGFGVVEAVGPESLPAVVFVTAYDEHAIRSFEVRALDYLLKPVDPRRFQKALKRASEQSVARKAKRLNQKISALLRSFDQLKAVGVLPAPPERIVIKEQGHILFLSADEIDWLCAHGNYVRLHAGRETHLLRETVGGMERRLDPRKFVRLRRSTIVRAELIKELHPLFNGEYAVILKDGTRLQWSRRYRKNLDALLKGVPLQRLI
jgi:two-component system, LytTR family, response regulator